MAEIRVHFAALRASWQMLIQFGKFGGGQLPNRRQRGKFLEPFVFELFSVQIATHRSQAGVGVPASVPASNENAGTL